MNKNTTMKKVKHQKFIRVGDTVIVEAGNDKGLMGEVLARSEERITIRGVNVCKKHMKPSQKYQQGGIIELEKAIHISNVRLCVEEDKPAKIGVTIRSDGARDLTYRLNGETKVLRSIKKGNS
jgi:large subunit ribosomal protein L24